MPTTPLAAHVFAKLADGRFHSGEELARSLEVSRSAVWKAVGVLRRLNVELEAVRNRGYRLIAATEPLDAARIRSQLPREVQKHVSRLETVWSTASTNTALLGRAAPRGGVSEVLLAEHQSAGRGRRGRTWLAPPGGAVCLSLSWTFAAVPPDLGALGLAVGVCALRALSELGVGGAALKWPNDLLVGERKLAGVLIDLRAESAGPAYVVIGIGLNVALGSEVLKKIAAAGSAATDLRSAGLASPARNRVAARLISRSIDGLSVFAREGLQPFLGEWREADALRGRAVEVKTVEGAAARGLARGIDAHGALVVETPRGLERFISGDVTVRPA
ncbi:MAG TPA: biotin--[acetyl-CoA-carboxylase] ligase [Steroidobacteraceae bacterium]|nr:biotin--[acetyl-CoA-carboxylase] ligase [Gammaproteobacteria bacterium]HEV2286091.1 biotin--[acetyl-CoA-carboxylase] ligase [Steroidobacteraceae bacterium]